MNPKTSIVSNSLHRDQHGASVQPLYMSTTFKVDLKSDNQEYDYSRSGNPTRSLLHKQIGRLYGVPQSQVHAVSSGMTALDTIIRGLVLSSSSHVPTILAGDDLYGGSDRLLTFLRTRCHARTVNVDTSDFERFQTAFLSLERVDCVHIESPTNPMCKVVDVPRIIAFIKKVSPQTYVVVDNTMMSGLLCNPLQLGADVVYESATKFLNGHHDIMAGIIVSRSQQIADEIYFVCNATGSGLAPMDAWLLIRGLKTLHVRLYQQQFNAMVLAEWLEQSCGFQEGPQAPGLRTRYVGLKSHPQFALHKSFNDGPGAVLAFDTGSLDLSRRIVSSRALKVWSVTVSFGCVNSLISLPCSMSHASIDPDVRKQRDFPEDLIRLCVGIEDIVDLQRDLLAAMVDAGVLEERGDMIHNLLNGHTARNTIGSEKYTQRSIYDLFYGGPQEKLEQKLSHRAIKL
ncbi:STR3 (YGL184C) [Zygosaccharomyces parabailii]|nr:STR3 (YGL184C) [Zygosaccharomyces parabailii]CDH11438.1 probable STR3-Cystathionine beta-lyase [Zygosaccharomyces bailii ISA1307]